MFPCMIFHTLTVLRDASNTSISPPLFRVISYQSLSSLFSEGFFEFYTFTINSWGTHSISMCVLKTSYTCCCCIALMSETGLTAALGLALSTPVVSWMSAAATTQAWWSNIDSCSWLCSSWWYDPVSLALRVKLKFKLWASLYTPNHTARTQPHPHIGCTIPGKFHHLVIWRATAPTPGHHVNHIHTIHTIMHCPF